MAAQVKKRWRVWTGSTWEPTWAVSEKQAVSNVAWRMRQAGKVPVRGMFRAEEVKDDVRR